MGSFYATCSLSGMTLCDGQGTMMQLLVPAWGTMQNELATQRGLLVSNDGAQMLFSPFGFPILGVYADYGDIEDIVRDQNVEMLEKYFGMEIDLVLQRASGGHDEPVFSYEDIRAMKGKNPGGVLTPEQVLSICTVSYFRPEVATYLSQQPLDKYDSGYLSRILAELPESTSSEEGLMSMDEVEAILCTQGSGEKVDHTTLMRALSALRTRPEGYVRGLVSANMFQCLPITKAFSTEVAAQYKLLYALMKLRKLLLPSCYGSQQDNWKETLKFNVFCNKLLRANKGYWQD